MSKNPHTQIAQLRLGGVHEWQSEEGSTDATNIAAAIDGLAEAVLALTWEQARCADELRTANQIAALQAVKVGSQRYAHANEKFAVKHISELHEQLFPEGARK
jgi:hypothetical protein